MHEFKQGIVFSAAQSIQVLNDIQALVNEIGDIILCVLWPSSPPPIIPVSISSLPFLTLRRIAWALQPAPIPMLHKYVELEDVVTMTVTICQPVSLNRVHWQLHVRQIRGNALRTPLEDSVPTSSTLRMELQLSSIRRDATVNFEVLKRFPLLNQALVNVRPALEEYRRIGIEGLSTPIIFISIVLCHFNVLYSSHLYKF